MKNIRFDFSNMIRTSGGITCEDMRLASSKLVQVHEALCAKEAEMAFRALPISQLADLKDIVKTAEEINARFEAFVVLGIGGSALGSKMLFNALAHLRHNELSREKRGCVKYYVAENVDPDGLNAIFDVVRPEKTCFHVITKSGSTVETLSQFMTVLSMLESRLGDAASGHIILTTDATSALKKIAAEGGYKTFTIPEGVGGRYSVLCPVGLLSAAVLQIDLTELLKGAEEMHEVCKCPDVYENPAYLYSLLLYTAMKKGYNIQVMMPYADAFVSLADWYLQLWAESLGKRHDVKNNEVFAGQTAVRALGATDQHSQIQLYIEGPADKIITFLETAKYKTTLAIGAPSADMPGMAYLAGQTFNKLITSELRATEYALTKAGRPNMRITVDEINAYTVGALILFFEMAAAATGEFLQINAFDQPGVEAGKQATFALMGKAGYEELAAELCKGEEKDERLVLSFMGE